jgi:hypothetical protein
MKYLILTLAVAAFMHSNNIGRSDQPRIQSDDPKKPFYVPPLPPDAVEAKDTFLIKTYQDFLDHPNSLNFVPGMEKAELDKIHKHVEKVEQDAALQKAAYDANWKPNKALDDIVGKNTSKQVKQACVGIVSTYQLMIENGKRIGQSQAMLDGHTRRFRQMLAKTCPDVPPEKLIKLLKMKPEDLCT